MAKLSLFVIFAVAVFSVTAEYSTINPANLKKLFDSVKPYSDLSSAFYSVKGLSLLGETLTAQSQTVLKPVDDNFLKQNSKIGLFSRKFATL
jgi:hypothetical protein